MGNKPGGPAPRIRSVNYSITAAIRYQQFLWPCRHASPCNSDITLDGCFSRSVTTTFMSTLYNTTIFCSVFVPWHFSIVLIGKRTFLERCVSEGSTSQKRNTPSWQSCSYRRSSGPAYGRQRWDSPPGTRSDILKFVRSNDIEFWMSERWKPSHFKNDARTIILFWC